MTLIVDYNENYTTSTQKRDYTRQQLANADFKAICADIGCDVEAEVKQFRKKHKGIKPGIFRWSGRKMTRLAWEQLRGRDGEGGTLGRLRVLEGEPLELRRVSIREIGLESLKNDAFAQFEPELLKICFDALEQHMQGCPFWAVLEYGRVKHLGHFHLYVKPGTCKLGVSSGIISDNKLVERTAYLMKPPVWTPLNAVAYVTVRHVVGTRVTSRISHRGLGNSRTRVVSVADIEVEVGFSLAAPAVEGTGPKKKQVVNAAISEPANLGRKVKTHHPVKETSANLGRRENLIALSQTERRKGVETQLPTLRNADPEETLLVYQLYAAWIRGDFEGQPGKTGAGCTNNLGAALGHYFARSWLSPGEVADLAQLANETKLLILDSPPAYQGVAV